MKRLVIGILAHVDAGKTTLSEGMLYQCGAIRKLGRVDHKDAFLDTHTLERDRGITIFSKQAQFRLGDADFTLLDTPGHVDFSTEMERTLQVLDYAILVINGAEGIQSHTQTLWRLLERYHIPVFLFINKMDLAGAVRHDLMLSLKNHLSESCADFTQDHSTEEFFESLAMCDEGLMERFLDKGRLEHVHITKAIQNRKVFPCYFGSALKMEGIDPFLAGLDRYTLPTNYSEAFGAKVFKIAKDEQGNRLTYMKITGGTLKVRSQLTGITPLGEDWTEKANQIRLYSGVKFQPVDEALPGMVCAVMGLSRTYPGEGLGAEEHARPPVLEPVLTYRVDLPPKYDPPVALMKLRQLEEEDPQLHVLWNEQLREIHIQIMGEVQLEILKSLLQDRFDLAVTFSQGSIVYKETIASAVTGVGHYEPLRHYAEVHLLLEPTDPGSGLTFATNCREEVLLKNWQRLILTHLEEKTHRGVLTGSPITDMRITLVAGRAHLKHTEGGDFRQATYRAVRQGLMMAKSILLEPWYQFRLELPTQYVGRAMTDLERMNAKLSPPETHGETAILSGSASVASIREYQTDVTGYTRGLGRLSCMPDGYRPCPEQDAVVEAIGYDAERDEANPADSVFCSHGAGYLVKWQDAPQHMHVDSGLRIGRPTQSVQPEATVRRPTLSMADDAELMKIFERTYGPIKDATRALRPTSRSSSGNNGTSSHKKANVPPMEQGPEYLLVDGYNIIFAWEDLTALAKEDVDHARTRLVDMLCNYRGVHQCELILVFDAYKVKGNPGSVEKVRNINVVYTKEAETADMYIEKVTHELGRKHRVRVATSDGLEQMIILGHGAERLSASMFRQEVDEAEAAVREYLQRIRIEKNRPLEQEAEQLNVLKDTLPE